MLYCAVEVDGKEHDRDYDNYRDEYNFRRSGIIVLRVRNNNIEDINEVLRVISLLDLPKERKERMGIAGSSLKVRKTLSDLPYDKNNLMFLKHLKDNYDHTPYWAVK